FLRSEAVIPDRFKNLILLIDGLSFGTFGFHPHEGFEDELILYIQKTNERVKTLFVFLYRRALPPACSNR
ncbi:hypothetical protein LIP46_11230, partial [Bifidobacterium breve]|uniref:hypothetical protein n=1 Tax=Bifidobacterium breve TaxID=1685 RepID=UPI0034D2770A|nr:hypothetical protein [Bifidobacterium breve]